MGERERRGGEERDQESPTSDSSSNPCCMHVCLGGKSTIGYYIISWTTSRSDLQVVTQATSAELGGLTNPKISRSCFFSTERRGGLRHSRDMLVPMSPFSLWGWGDRFPYCIGVTLVTSGPHTGGLLCGFGGLPSIPTFSCSLFSQQEVAWQAAPPPAEASRKERGQDSRKVPEKVGGTPGAAQFLNNDLGEFRLAQAKSIREPQK